MRKIVLFLILFCIPAAMAGQNEDAVRQEHKARETESYMKVFRAYGNTLRGTGIPSPNFETKIQKAARINMQTYSSVRSSVDHNLDFYRIHIFNDSMTDGWNLAFNAAMIVAGLFFSPQFSVPYGYVPVDYTVPFLYTKIPGWGPDPYSWMYSPENIPQCITSEFDEATGTYKQVMVDWNTVSGYTYNLNPKPGTDMKALPVQHFNSFEKNVFGY